MYCHPCNSCFLIFPGYLLLCIAHTSPCTPAALLLLLQVELLLDMLPDTIEQLLAEAGHIPDTRTLDSSRPLPE
jgi:hypothetical protein